MDAAQFDLALAQGVTYERTFRWLIDGVAQPLAEYTAKAQVRQKEDTSAKLLLDLTPHLSVETGDTLRLRVPATITALLNPKLFRRAAWDLFLITTADPSEAFTLVEGAATCDPATTDTTTYGGAP